MAAKRKTAARKPTPKKSPGRKPNQYVVVWNNSAEGPYTTTELTNELESLAEDGIVDMNELQIFKLDHEVRFRAIPARYELLNGSASN